MKKLFVTAIMLQIGLVSLADVVQIDFDVRDYEGNPIEGVNIKCSRWEKPASRFVKAKTITNDFATDADGKVSAKFDSWNGYVDCYFKAEGYYPEEAKDVIFRASYEQGTDKYVFRETAKHMRIGLRKIKNPTPMVFHRLFKTSKRLPAKSGRFGFDLEKGDWVAPHGEGSVADVNVAYGWQEDGKVRSCTGAVEFVDRGCGAYVKKKLPCKLMPVDYAVDENATFKTCFPFSLKRDLVTDEYHESRVISEDEYLVVRTRVKLDSKGEIIEANYSQIHGPVIIGRYFSLGDWFFNLRINDLNLEYEQPR